MIGFYKPYFFEPLMMISAAITPGIHPANVRMNTISTEPQPLSTTARGGNMIDKITLNKDMNLSFMILCLLHVASTRYLNVHKGIKIILYSSLNSSTK